LLVKETLNAKELAQVFAPVKKAPERQLWLSDSQRPDSDLPPVPIPETLKRSVGMKPGE
jgi:cell division protease FtsH